MTNYLQGAADFTEPNPDEPVRIKHLLWLLIIRIQIVFLSPRHSIIQQYVTYLAKLDPFLYSF